MIAGVVSSRAHCFRSRLSECVNDDDSEQRGHCSGLLSCLYLSRNERVPAHPVALLAYTIHGTDCLTRGDCPPAGGRLTQPNTKTKKTTKRKDEILLYRLLIQREP